MLPVADIPSGNLPPSMDISEQDGQQEERPGAEADGHCEDLSARRAFLAGLWSLTDSVGNGEEGNDVALNGAASHETHLYYWKQDCHPLCYRTPALTKRFPRLDLEYRQSQFGGPASC